MRELENRLMKHIDLLMERYPSLESAKDDIVAAYLLLEESYKNGGKLLVGGMAVLRQMRSISLVS